MTVDPAAVATASVLVLTGEEPVRVVTHYHDGTWDFSCATTSDPAEVVTVHAQHVFEQFPDLAGLRGLPRGHRAEREESGRTWATGPDVTGK
ncbi:MAG: hypothetical protein M3P48_01400 [Actinomycetota bacterium]|nr:hypothetical protein [Actinomycetota bacterium]